MSMGRGAFATLIAEDETEVLYSYGTCNLDIPKQHNKAHQEDGSITIEKSALPLRVTRIKRKRLPSGKKKNLERPVKIKVDIGKLLLQGNITVESGRDKSYTISIVGDREEISVDAMALWLLHKIFASYQSDGWLPKKVFYDA